MSTADWISVSMAILALFSTVAATVSALMALANIKQQRKSMIQQEKSMEEKRTQQEKIVKQQEQNMKQQWTQQERIINQQQYAIEQQLKQQEKIINQQKIQQDCNEFNKALEITRIKSLDCVIELDKIYANFLNDLANQNWKVFFDFKQKVYVLEENTESYITWIETTNAVLKDKYKEKMSYKCNGCKKILKEYNTNFWWEKNEKRMREI